MLEFLARVSSGENDEVGDVGQWSWSWENRTQGMAAMVVHPAASPLLAKCLVRTFPEQWHSTRVGSRTQLPRWGGGGWREHRICPGA